MKWEISSIKTVTATSVTARRDALRAQIKLKITMVKERGFFES